jgi:hypothetical protein
MIEESQNRPIGDVTTGEGWPRDMVKHVYRFDTGLIPFTLNNGDGETSHEVDTLLATTVADELVRKHKLPIENDQYVFTPEFLDELAAAFSRWFKLPAINGDIAVRIWVASQVKVYGIRLPGGDQ